METLFLSRKARILVGALFLTYLALLTKVILFKYPLHIIMIMLRSEEHFPLSFRIAHSNFVPFRTILYYLAGNQSMRIAVSNLLGNLIAFAPLGLLLPLVFARARKLKVVVTLSGLLSLAFEIVQLLTGIGDFDVDDILLNVVGSVCGYLIYRATSYLFSKKR